MSIPEKIAAYFLPRFEILKAQSVQGGCINDCYLLETSEGNFFLKLNDAKAYPNMFAVEASGLKLLANTKTVRIPEVYETGECRATSFLLMQFIEKGKVKDTTLRELGAKVGALHLNSNTQFGLSHNNYIGSLSQTNTYANTWTEFFIEQRLKPQMKMAFDRKLFSSTVINDFETLFTKLDELMPKETPSLLHGDLWTGNFIVDKNQNAWLMDPAVYYGHREMDLAATRLFGSFGDDFYEGYNECYPIAPDWQQRIDLCNLYPWLVHVNLFGNNYLGEVIRALGKYV